MNENPIILKIKKEMASKRYNSPVKIFIFMLYDIRFYYLEPIARNFHNPWH